MLRRTTSLVLIIILVVIISAALFYVYNEITHTGVNVNIDQRPDLKNKFLAILSPDPNDSGFTWHSNTIYSFVIESNNNVVTVNIQQDDNYLHIISDQISNECPTNSDNYLIEYNYYNNDIVKILACSDTYDASDQIIEQLPVIQIKNNHNILNEYSITIENELTSVIPTPVSRIKTYSSIADNSYVPNSIITYLENNSIVMEWPSVANALKYEVRRRYCFDVCGDWHYVGDAFDTKNGIAKFIDNSTMIQTYSRNLFQYEMRTVIHDGASAWSNTIYSIINLTAATDGYIIKDNSLTTSLSMGIELLVNTYSNTGNVEYLIYKSTNNKEYYFDRKATSTASTVELFDHGISEGVETYCYKVQVKHGTNYGLIWPENGECATFETLLMDDILALGATTTRQYLSNQRINVPPYNPLPTPIPLPN